MMIMMTDYDRSPSVSEWRHLGPRLVLVRRRAETLLRTARQGRDGLRGPDFCAFLPCVRRNAASQLLGGKVSKGRHGPS